MQNENTRNILTEKKFVCIECGVEFIFSKGEQAYYLSKGLVEPKRCNNCRKTRKDNLIISKLG